MEKKIEGKIEAISSPRDFYHDGRMIVGVKVSGNWVNLPEAEFEKNKDLLKRGNQIIMAVREDGTIAEITAVDTQKPEEPKAKFQDMLQKARPEIVSIETELVNFDMEKRWAVVKAVIKTKNGETFQAYGDSTQENTGKFTSDAFIRMAETRAIARALRWFLAEGTAEEEV